MSGRTFLHLICYTVFLVELISLITPAEIRAGQSVTRNNQQREMVANTYSYTGVYVASVTDTNLTDTLTETTLISISTTLYQCYLPFIQNCSSPSHPLVNGDFELGDFGWMLFGPSSIVSSENGIVPHGGNMMASIISYGIIGIDPGYIEQTFTIPSCFSYLRFWWSSIVGCNPVSGSRCGGDLSIDIDGMPFTSLHASGDGTKPWEEIVVDMSAYRGRTITLRFTANSFRDSISNYIDDITFQNHP